MKIIVRIFHFIWVARWYKETIEWVKESNESLHRVDFSEGMRFNL